MRSTILLFLIIGVFALRNPNDLFKIVSNFEARFSTVIDTKDIAKFLALFHPEFKYNYCSNRTVDLSFFAPLISFGTGMIRDCTNVGVVLYSENQEIQYNCETTKILQGHKLYDIHHWLKKNQLGEWVLYRIFEKEC